MIVYVLELSHYYDGDRIVGVHASRDSAIHATTGSLIVGEFWEQSAGFWKAHRSDDLEWHITEWEVCDFAATAAPIPDRAEGR